MVTKLLICLFIDATGSVLAKIHMVTKQYKLERKGTPRSVLAKIHMVTKLKEA